MGFLFAWCVHSAGVQDRDGARLVLGCERVRQLPRVEKILLDSGYRGELKVWIENELGWQSEVVQRQKSKHWTGPQSQPQPKPAFEVLKWRWIVERTFAWMGRYRRLSKDYEHTCSSSEGWMLVAMTSLMIHRLEPL